MFTILTRLRLLCDHPMLIFKKLGENNNLFDLEFIKRAIKSFFQKGTSDEYLSKMINHIKNEEIENCLICYAETNELQLSQFLITDCGHIFCKDCFKKTTEIKSGK